ncbi:MAG: bifunctional tRNA (5-methylaminomethyl-2-thiouridine)(34)-methyltransferase MnmD/FAD-dependent 5-carboxymethylaminomethyl-2-thiouridine(34) oxidoreductase MnmC [Pseudomonadales bacterium]|nr:bifunctional tRNA (5-methylaminomethyl-2-thiouridine)(34)-methyltransferase MnmD/FAD-dependent 5-carboxymethylaminomethyl-2-thiouridine(34) oxidoreductase MnmC [Pseudomonadales bacterium]
MTKQKQEQSPTQEKDTRKGKGKDQHLAELVKPAELQWHDNGTPVSTQFDDVYYSSNNGLEETRYVFLQHNQLEARWQLLPDTARESFTIAETGFGTGLNFLAAWQAWKNSPIEKATLHFISVEKFPLERKDLAKSLSTWSELKPLTEQLIDHYPPLVTGFHRIEFPKDRIKLTLIFDDAIKGFQQLIGGVDAWFLDGFAPSKNPDMWQPELFEQISRLSKKRATLATFTSAGVVRRGLESVGFEIKKHKGFGHKREMVSGEKHLDNTQASHLPYNRSPWYINGNRPAKAISKVLVVGAGLAGSATASALALRNYDVTVIESENAIAQRASGNPVGMTFTRLSPFDNAQNRFYQKAYLYSINQIREGFEKSPLIEGKDYALNGVLRFAFSEKEKLEQEKLLSSGLWPSSLAKALTPEECAALIDIQCPFGGLFLTEGGWLTPADLCQQLLSAENIKLHLNTKIESLSFDKPEQSWQVHLADSEQQSNHIVQADAIVYANSFGANKFPGLEFLPLRSVRGQITYIPANAESQCFSHALNYEGYITPAKDGYHCVGATFHPKIETEAFREEDHQTNLTNLKKTIPNLYEKLGLDTTNDPLAHRGRVAFRCQSPDYLPMIGPIPDLEEFKEDYQNLRKGLLKGTFPLGHYLPNIYVNVAHGSRGITSSIFAAEMIACYINNEPQPIDKEVIEAVHPARFAIRGLKRNQL